MTDDVKPALPADLQRGYEAFQKDNGLDLGHPSDHVEDPSLTPEQRDFIASILAALRAGEDETDDDLDDLTDDQEEE